VSTGGWCADERWCEEVALCREHLVAGGYRVSQTEHPIEYGANLVQRQHEDIRCVIEFARCDETVGKSQEDEPRHRDTLLVDVTVLLFL